MSELKLALKLILKYIVLFIIGGLTYYLLEILFRGHSHWTMIILGGLCFTIIGSFNEYIPWGLSIISQMIYGAFVITGLELLTGELVNRLLGWNVWDYSNLPFNVDGQICLAFFLLWIPVSGVAIVLDDYIRYWFFGEEKPHYSLRSKI